MATVSVQVPTLLRKLTGGQDRVEVSGTTVGQSIDNLERTHPGLKYKLCDDTGNLRRFINIYVNQDDIRFLNDLDTPLNDGDELVIIPAIAGG
jgi:molybdopterin synthase sulfur carrier subunit